jgi:serine phosphatase RsbU (regulator of sigma subunit)
MMGAAEASGVGKTRREARPLARRLRIRWPFWLAVGVLVVGLLVTGALTWVSSGLYTSNEKRLLSLRARDVATVLTAALPSLQTPLASAAALADASGSDTRKAERFLAPYVGTGGARPFVSISLWRVGDPERGPVAVLGRPPALSSASAQTRALFDHASASLGLSVIGFLHAPPLRLGYASTGGVSGPYAAYGESALPGNRYTPVQNNSAFSDLDFALYLGASMNPQNLLVASVRHLPLNGRRTSTKVPFGNTFFTVEVAARGPLGGSLPQRLPWAIAILGILLTLAAGALTARLIERRRNAEGLARRLEEVAEENRRLYAQQRGIAETLQHALLPDSLPQLPGLQASARYEPGVEGMEVGGDWYDLIALDDRRLLLVVGDVSGRGLRAATTMAALRYAIHAYAAQGDPPATLLAKLSRLLDVGSEGQLATVLCALVDVQARQVTVTSAGHLPPLMIVNGDGRFVQSEVGLPVGVDREPSYASSTISAPPGAIFLAFTDGLVERRGESIDTGLERLRQYASGNHATLDELLTRVLGHLRKEAVNDDTAIAGIRWVS